MTASQIPMDTPNEGDLAPEAEEPRRRRRRILLLLFLVGALLFLLMLAIWYLLFRQPILPPLPLVADVSLPSYSTSIYNVNGPMGVAVNSAGDRIYVSQTVGETGVLMFDGGGNLVGTFETPPGSVHVPVYLAIDPLTQDVYVSDRMAAEIYVYDPAGKLRGKYNPTEPRPGWQPMGMGFDGAGNLYVTDLSGRNEQVLVFDRQGALVRTFGADSNLTFPNGVSIDGAGNAWVADSNNGRLLVFDAAGGIIGSVGRGVGEGNLGLPRGVVVAGERVFVADNTAQGVFAYRPIPEGEKAPPYIGTFGSEGVGDGQFQFPNGIAADGRGRLYVTDFGNDRVQVWSY
jgi:tripartite motif-containing protein 71